MNTMSDSDTDTLWDFSPTAELVLEAGRITRLNRACRELFLLKELSEKHVLDTDDWDAVIFDERNRQLIQRFLSGNESAVSLDFLTEGGRKLYLTARKKLLDRKTERYLLVFQDVTEIRENSQAFQAGYDEFLKVTIELENALETIESQKEQLQRQKDILENELEIAHSVQEQLFDEDFTRFQHVRVHGYYRAMTELGGDMWEMLEDQGNFMAVLGDVMGHGVAPSLISIAAKALFKKSFEEQAYRPESLARICEHLNTELLDITNGDYYITICSVKIDADFNMEYITAGHPPLMIVPRDPDDEVRFVNTDQPMLGILPRVELNSKQTQVKRGDRILLYTDCLNESLDPEGHTLNVRELADLVRFKDDNTPADAIQNILDHLTRFTGHADFDDDLTLICLEIPVA